MQQLNSNGIWEIRWTFLILNISSFWDNFAGEDWHRPPAPLLQHLSQPPQPNFPGSWSFSGRTHHSQGQTDTNPARGINGAAEAKLKTYQTGNVFKRKIKDSECLHEQGEGRLWLCTAPSPPLGTQTPPSSAEGRQSFTFAQISQMIHEPAPPRSLWRDPHKKCAGWRLDQMGSHCSGIFQGLWTSPVSPAEPRHCSLF